FQFIIDIHITADNTVYALSSQGTVLKILPHKDIQPGSPPGLLLTSLLVNNKWNDLTRRSLAYNQNNLQFTVAAPSFIDEKSIRYSYLLEGSGINEWSEASNNASFNFINLSPGSYTLKVRSEFPEAQYPTAFLS